GSDVLAAGGLDQVRLAIGDPEIAGGVQVADVAGVEVAVLVDHFGGRFRQAEIPAHDVAPAHEDLAVLRDLHLHAGEGPAHRAELVLPGQVDAGDGDGLGEPVAFEDVEA